MGGATWQEKEASSPRVPDKREAERLPRGSSVGDGWQGGPSRGTEHSGDTAELHQAGKEKGLQVRAIRATYYEKFQ